MNSNLSEDSAEIAVIIPAYKPAEQLLTLVDEMMSTGRYHVIVVDDGSHSSFKHIFESLNSKTHVLKHEENLGKGAALKTAFQYALSHFPQLKGVVTADADGQHTTKDILNICEHLKNNDNCLIIGTRTFQNSYAHSTKIPLRSQFGNKLTKHVFRLFTGRNLNDTQSGLRGIEKNLLPTLIDIEANKYEFELEMLIKAKIAGYSYKEIPIETVYFNHNASSHFNPISDSLKIYYVFIRYLFFSFFTAIIDNLIFAASFYFTDMLIPSLILGRLFACTFQFSTNKKIVFKSKEKTQFEFFKYTTLVLCNLAFSYLLIWFFIHLQISPYISKIIAESFIFIVSFFLQKFYIFKITGSRGQATG